MSIYIIRPSSDQVLVQENMDVLTFSKTAKGFVVNYSNASAFQPFWWRIIHVTKLDMLNARSLHSRFFDTLGLEAFSHYGVYCAPRLRLIIQGQAPSSDAPPGGGPGGGKGGKDNKDKVGVSLPSRSPLVIFLR